VTDAGGSKSYPREVELKSDLAWKTKFRRIVKPREKTSFWGPRGVNRRNSGTINDWEIFKLAEK